MKKNSLNKKNIFRGIRIFLIISILAVTIILVFTVTNKTKEELKLISPLFIAFTIFATALRFLFDIWRLRYIIEAMGRKLSWSGGFYFTLGGLFLGGVTPMQVGGIPLQLYVCRKENIPLPEGSAAIFTRGLLSAFVLPFLIPFIYTYRVYFSTGMVQGIIKYLSILYGVIAVLFIFILIKSDWITKKFSGKFVEGIVKFKNVFRQEFVRRKGKFLKAYGMTWLSLIFYFLTAPLLLRGLCINANFLKTAVLQIILTYALNFMPTPGASGFAEGGAFFLFKSIIPKSLLGVYVVLWRFFTGYLGMIIGGIALSKFFGTTDLDVNTEKKDK